MADLKAFAKGYKKPREAPDLSPEERLALHRLRQLAYRNGVSLQSAGRGGLSPSLVLHVMRRDQFTCKACGESVEAKGGLSVHHKGGIVESKWLLKKGHHNAPNNIVTICGACHDRVHNKAREEGVDSSQADPALSEIDTLDFGSFIDRATSNAVRLGLDVAELSNGACVYTGGEGPRVAILSGLHGEERAGPIAALQFLSGKQMPPGIQLWVCPLMSSEVWEKRERDIDGTNYNRVWNADAPAIVVEAMKSLEAFDPLVFIDLHEDSTIEDGRPYIHHRAGTWGPELAGVLDVVGEPWSALDNETAESFAQSISCERTATIETAQTEDLADRVRFQRLAISSVINLARKEAE